jgi:hypothetical protein
MFLTPYAERLNLGPILVSIITGMVPVFCLQIRHLAGDFFALLLLILHRAGGELAGRLILFLFSSMILNILDKSSLPKPPPA